MTIVVQLVLSHVYMTVMDLGKSEVSLIYIITLVIITFLQFNIT